MPHPESNAPRASVLRRMLGAVVAAAVFVASLVAAVVLAIAVADRTETWLDRQPGLVQKVGSSVPVVLLTVVICFGFALAREVWERIAGPVTERSAEKIVHEGRKIP